MVCQMTFDDFKMDTNKLKVFDRRDLVERFPHSSDLVKD